MPQTRDDALTLAMSDHEYSRLMQNYHLRSSHP